MPDKLSSYSLLLFFAASLFAQHSLAEATAAAPLPVKAAAPLPVKLMKVRHQDAFASQRVYAGQSVAGRTAQLGFNRGGRLEWLAADVGDRVAAGDVLARLDTRALRASQAQAQADVELARANLEAARADATLAGNTEARMRTLREQGHASRQLYDEAELGLRARRAQSGVARANLQRAEAALLSVQVALEESAITAPFAGVVQARNADEGTQVQPAQPVLRLVEQGALEAHIGIPSRVAGRLQPGEQFPIRWEGADFPATLAAVLPEIDPATRTLTAVFKLGGAAIPVGTLVELTLNEQIAGPGFWLPMTALTASDRGLWGVYVVNPDNRVERRLVEIVHSEADRVFVRGTLSHEDRVIQTGVQRVVPGQIVTASALHPAG